MTQQISHSIIMYVTLRNPINVEGRLPCARRLSYYFGMDNEERSRRLATLDTHGRLPTSDLAVETMTLSLGGHYAVHLSLWGGSRQLTRLRNSFELGFCHFTIFLLQMMVWCEKKACGLVGMYDS